MRRIRAGSFFLFALIAVAVPVFGQPQPAADPTFVKELRLESKLLKRAVDYIAILPPSYEQEKAERFPVVFLLHGLTGRFNNWNSKTNLAAYARQFRFIIVTPEGHDGWYTDSATVADDKFESYLVSELFPEIDRRFRTRTDRDGRFIAGLSMGGYGALKFGLKHPDKFAAVGSFSGALRAAEWNVSNRGEWIGKSIMSVFGPADSDTRKANDIYRLAREWPSDRVGELPFIYLDCGTEDFLIENSVEFARLLREKKIRHEYRELPGRHDWVYWNSQVFEFLRIADRIFFAQRKAKP